jgi:hypothetical protein
LSSYNVFTQTISVTTEESKTSEPPPFFVPGCDPSKQEAVYQELARRAAQWGVPLDIGQRIYSITFIQDGKEQWTATVGEQLRGHTVADPQARAKKRRFSRPLSDPAKVLAIFAGAPYVVVTDARINPDVRSTFESPFLAGIPTSVTYFRDAPSPTA